jgi:hypothetical protein
MDKAILSLRHFRINVHIEALRGKKIRFTAQERAFRKKFTLGDSYA